MRNKKQWASLIALASVLVICMTGLLIYIAAAPDFKAPAETDAVINTDDPVWSATYDDLIAYLKEGGFISGEPIPISEGIATEANNYSEVELYWWDVENLADGTGEKQCWDEMQNQGYIMLYGQFVFVPEMNGPFGLFISDVYAGDADGLRAAFQAFPGGE